MEQISRRKGARAGVIAANVVFLLLIGVVDYISGFEISFSIFYLIPILIVVRLEGIWPGVAMSVLSAVVWGAVDRISGHQYASVFILYWNSAVRLSFFLLISFMFSKIVRLYERERKMSRTDFLTGIANLRSFYDSVENEMDRARRYGGAFTVSYVDIDNFKYINDSFGHPAGDELLTRVAKTLRDNIRTTDVAGRVGGDEFAVLMPETGGNGVKALLERIQKALEKEIGKRDWPVTFSIGSATFNTPPSSVQEVMAKADDLMYYVKLSGKNNIKHEVFG